MMLLSVHLEVDYTNKLERASVTHQSNSDVTCTKCYMHKINILCTSTAHQECFEAIACFSKGFQTHKTFTSIDRIIIIYIIIIISSTDISIYFVKMMSQYPLVNKYQLALFSYIYIRDNIKPFCNSGLI